MKSVLISIQPKWCELIANGQKTIDVRKTRPKIETPFKCYIYETKGKADMPTFVDEDGHVSYEVGGQVIGEFLCDKIYNYIADDFVGAIDFDGTIRETPVDGDFGYWIPEEKSTCMSYYDILKYGKGETLYGWHISDLTIYDKPRELSKFVKYRGDWRNLAVIGALTGLDCNAYLKRPPQSWCYVEEV